MHEHKAGIELVVFYIGLTPIEDSQKRKRKEFASNLGKEMSERREECVLLCLAALNLNTTEIFSPKACIIIQDDTSLRSYKS